MKADALKWFAERDLHIHSMIKRRPRGMAKEHIESAASIFYEMVESANGKHVLLKNGQKVKILAIARNIHKIVDSERAEEYAKKWKLLETYGMRLDSYSLKYNRLCGLTLALIAAVATYFVNGIL